MSDQDYIIESLVLEDSVCLFEGGANALLERLEKLMDRVEANQMHADGILIIRKGPADDYTKTWLRELESTLLADDLCKRIMRLRRLFSRIRQSSIPWAYAANERIIGTHWELALACRERYIFAEACPLGFPEIRVGAFPPGGLIENIGRNRNRTRDRLAAVPVAEPRYAIAHNIIQFCGEAADFGEHAKRLFSRRIHEKVLRTLHPTAIPINPEDTGVPRHEILERLSKKLPAFQPGKSKQASAWDLCWTLAKQYRSDQAHTINDEIAVLTAQFYLSGRYRTWLSKQIALRSRITKQVGTARTVMIDLDHLAPPSAIFDRLIHLNTNLVFVAADAKSLQFSLDLVYHRLEKDLEWHELNRFWRGHVSWFVGSPDENDGTYLRFLVDDRVQVCHNGQKTQIIRLGGNDRPADRGACEWPTHEQSPELDAAVRLTAARVVRTTPIGEDRIPISLWVRSLCFEELIRIAPHFNNELTQVVDCLGDQGWDFAGRVEAWDRFLRTRSLGYPFSEEMGELCGKSVSQSTWEVGMFKHARLAAKRSGVPDAGAWSPTELSVHLAVFSGLLALIIAEKGWCKDLIDAEVLCMESLGLPDAFGSPLSYIHRRGRRRVAHYAEMYWAGFDDTLIWRHV